MEERNPGKKRKTCQPLKKKKKKARKKKGEEDICYFNPLFL